MRQGQLMLSRKTVRTLATAYAEMFEGHSHEEDPGWYYTLTDDLHDFLWDGNYEDWFINSLTKCQYTAILRKRIMHLETGDSINAPEWSAEARANLGRNLLLSLDFAV